MEQRPDRYSDGFRRTLVRLKLISVVVSITHATSFRRTLVRLKPRTSLEVMVLCCFRRTLVRLKQKIRSDSNDLVLRFQTNSREVEALGRTISCKDMSPAVSDELS